MVAPPGSAGVAGVVVTPLLVHYNYIDLVNCNLGIDYLIEKSVVL